MIEGIPEGWEQEKVGQISFGEYWVNNFGQPQRWDSDHPSSSKNYVIIRKIEKVKQYRPFANAAEFEPFRDRWFCPKIKRNHLIKTSAYNEHRHWSGEEPDTWEKMFDEYVFDDGTPFGIEVTE